MFGVHLMLEGGIQYGVTGYWYEKGLEYVTELFGIPRKAGANLYDSES